MMGWNPLVDGTARIQFVPYTAILPVEVRTNAAFWVAAVDSSTTPWLLNPKPWYDGRLALAPDLTCIAKGSPTVSTREGLVAKEGVVVVDPCPNERFP